MVGDMTTLADSWFLIQIVAGKKLKLLMHRCTQLKHETYTTASSSILSAINQI